MFVVNYAAPCKTRSKLGLSNTEETAEFAEGLIIRGRAPTYHRINHRINHEACSLNCTTQGFPQWASAFGRDPYASLMPGLRVDELVLGQHVS